MNPFVALLALASGYLLGSVSFARVVSNLVAPGTDITKTQAPQPDSNVSIQMHGVSATSVRLQLGSKFGILTSFLDMVKAGVPVFLWKLAFPAQPYFLIAAAMVVIGHNWPVYYGFKGGYGSSPAYGGLLVIDWRGLLVSVAVTGLGYGVSRSMYAALITGFFALVPFFWLRTHRWEYVLYGLVVSVAYLITLLPDIRSYRQATRRARHEARPES